LKIVDDSVVACECLIKQRNAPTVYTMYIKRAGQAQLHCPVSSVHVSAEIQMTRGFCHQSVLYLM